MDHAHRVKERNLEVPIAGGPLEATLGLVDRPRGLVVFAHGAGGGRRSPRQRRVAALAQESGFCTVLVDLLRPNEETVDRITSQFRFDVELLARRLGGVTAWLRSVPELQGHTIGCFGSSAAGGAALIAAAERPDLIHALVSLGGRPDLAAGWLSRVRAPTLLIVGAKDVDVVARNQQAIRELTVEKRLEIVAGATHLLDEPGAIEEVSRLATTWLSTFLR